MKLTEKLGAQTRARAGACPGRSPRRIATPARIVLVILAAMLGQATPWANGAQRQAVYAAPVKPATVRGGALRTVADLRETSRAASPMPAPARDMCLDLGVRLDRWQRSGVHFEGDWQADELIPILDSLDAFKAAFGQDRFHRLTRQALTAETEQDPRPLTIVRTSDAGLPPGAWAPQSGRIYINETLYDAQHLSRHYAWTHLWHEASSSRSIAPQQVIIAHELGHVAAAGLNGAQRQPDAGSDQLAEIYATYLAPELWPNPGKAVSENVATEIGLWALGAHRPEPVTAFRRAHLAPLIFAESVSAQ